LFNPIFTIDSHNLSAHGIFMAFDTAIKNQRKKISRRSRTGHFIVFIFIFFIVFFFNC